MASKIIERMIESCARAFAKVNVEYGCTILDKVTLSEGEGVVIAVCDDEVTFVSVLDSTHDGALERELLDRQYKAADWLRMHPECSCKKVGFDTMKLTPIGPVVDGPVACTCDHTVGEYVYDLTSLVRKAGEVA